MFPSPDTVTDSNTGWFSVPVSLSTVALMFEAAHCTNEIIRGPRGAERALSLLGECSLIWRKTPLASGGALSEAGSIVTSPTMLGNKVVLNSTHTIFRRIDGHRVFMLLRILGIPESGEARGLVAKLSCEFRESQALVDPEDVIDLLSQERIIVVNEGFDRWGLGVSRTCRTIQSR